MNANIEAQMVLPNGHAVPLALYTSIVAHVKEMIPGLPQGVAVTLKVLCGRDFWDALPIDDHTTAGRIVACLVSYNELDLSFVGCKHSVPKRYMRR